MDKVLVIDSRMRENEKRYLKKLGYKLFELKKQDSVYYEVSSHVDMFFSKLNQNIIVEKSLYNNLDFSDIVILRKKNIFCGNSEVNFSYPHDIIYNVCNIGKFAIHNFKYTDKKILDVIQKEKLEKININQGYSKCSIAVVDDNSAIVNDMKIANILKLYNIDVLLLEQSLDIKLYGKDGKYSNMNGFIGGATSRLDNTFIVFGDTKKIDKEEKIKKFVESKGIKLVDFKGIDVIDYGGILLI